MVYGIIYGQTATTLASDLGVTPHHAAELITQFMGYFGEVRAVGVSCVFSFPPLHV